MGRIHRAAAVEAVRPGLDVLNCCGTGCAQARHSGTPAFKLPQLRSMVAVVVVGAAACLTVSHLRAYSGSGATARNPDTEGANRRGVD